MQYWVEIAEKRILKLLEKSRISYNAHLEIKISEAGPNYMRAEPHIISQAIKSLKIKKQILSIEDLKEDLIDKIGIDTSDSVAWIFPINFGSAGDISRAKHFLEWRQCFLEQAQKSEVCGLTLEYLIFKSILKSQKYHIIGSGPTFVNDILTKGKSSEILDYDGKEIYKKEKGSGFDLFAIHKKTDIPIGIEAKNKREWIYPASQEVWRTIARATTLECLPVLLARKISYIAKAGLFSEIGMLGFNTNFQYFDKKVLAASNYKFQNNVINKDRLGFADIKLISKKTAEPEFLINFFENILDNNIEQYYETFLKNKKSLYKYSIDYEMAEVQNSGKRFKLYKEFQLENGMIDIELPEFPFGSGAYIEYTDDEFYDELDLLID